MCRNRFYEKQIIGLRYYKPSRCAVDFFWFIYKTFSKYEQIDALVLCYSKEFGKLILMAIRNQVWANSIFPTLIDIQLLSTCNQNSYENVFWHAHAWYVLSNILFADRVCLTLTSRRSNFAIFTAEWFLASRMDSIVALLIPILRHSFSRSKSGISDRHNKDGKLKRNDSRPVNVDLFKNNAENTVVCMRALCKIMCSKHHSMH